MSFWTIVGAVILALLLAPVIIAILWALFYFAIIALSVLFGD
jgi:hypothetical protein